MRRGEAWWAGECPSDRESVFGRGGLGGSVEALLPALGLQDRLVRERQRLAEWVWAARQALAGGVSLCSEE